MQISISDEIEFFQRADVTSLKQMAELCLRKNFSPALFTNGKRNKANFETAYCIGLDIDNDGAPDPSLGGAPTPKMSLDEAKQIFKDYKCLILPSRSHRKPKHDRVEDRFRVILFFSEPINDLETMYQTWANIKELWPAIDNKCKNPDRFYYKHSGVSLINEKGLTIVPVKPTPRPKIDSSVSVPVVPLHPSARGALGKATHEYLERGPEKGDRNQATVRAAKDFQQNLYSVEEATEQILAGLNKTDSLARDFTEAEVIKTIRSAYNTEARHEPRIEPKAFNLVSIADIYKSDIEMEWIVDELLSKGGISLMSSDPKAGKSTLARQLMRSILRGTEFLGRKCKQGSVQYYGMEEQVEVLKKSFARLGIKSEESLLVHVGDAQTDAKLQDFKEILLATKPTLAVIDTAFDFIDVESENNYREVKREFRKLAKIARESGTHILLIHHNSKAGRDDRRRGNRGILGSQAIAGAMDTIMVIELDGNTRQISSSGREIVPWSNKPMVFDFKERTYSLDSRIVEDEF